MTDPVNITISIIILILLIVFWVWVACCGLHEREISIELISRDITQHYSIQKATPNQYNIILEKPTRENISVQTTKSVWWPLEEEDTEPPLHYCSLPASLASLASRPVLPLPYFPSAPEPEVGVEEEETESSEEEHETDDQPLEGTSERQPLNTTHTVDISQSQSDIQSRQFRDLEITSDILITRVARIERRLKQNNI